MPFQCLVLTILWSVIFPKCEIRLHMASRFGRSKFTSGVRASGVYECCAWKYPGDVAGYRDLCLVFNPCMTSMLQMHENHRSGWSARSSPCNFNLSDPTI